MSIQISSQRISKHLYAISKSKAAIRINAALQSILFLLVIVMIAVFSPIEVRFVMADDDVDDAVSALRPGNDISWSQMTVKILDPDGKVLTGATVRPWALRAGNAHGWWNEKIYGSPRKTITDDLGTTTVVFPKTLTWSVKDSNPVVQVSMVISHPGFCSKNEHVNVPADAAPDVPEVRLERGFQLRLAGVVPGSDQPLPHCHAMLENDDVSDPEFIQEKDGWLQSVPVRQDRRWFRIVYLPPGGPPQFSKPTAWTPEDPASREVRVEVRPGVRLKGTIDDSVERPIERGHVVAWCGSPIQRDAGKGNRFSPIWWIETVPIAADGTFEFPSLPSGYLAQIYAFANDSISAQPSDEAFKTCCKWFAIQNEQRHQVFRYGQVLRLAGAESQFTIEMEPAGVVRVKCVDPAGKPLKGIMVSSWPNQFMVGGGSTIYCGRNSTLQGILGQKRSDWWNDSPFSIETNADGEALVRNLPEGKQSFYAGSDHWIGPDGEQALSDPEKITVLEMKLERIR